MERQLSDLLEELEAILRKANAQLLDQMNPRLDDEKISSYEKQVQVEFSEDVRQLYRWKNGTRLSEGRTIAQQNLFGFGIFYPLQDVIGGYKAFYPEDQLKKHMLPIFGSGGGDYLFVNVNKSGGTSGMVFLYSPALLYTEVPSAYCDSLSSMISCIITCYKNGIYKFDIKQNELVIDYESEDKVFSQLNPRSSFWKV